MISSIIRVRHKLLYGENIAAWLICPESYCPVQDLKIQVFFYKSLVLAKNRISKRVSRIRIIFSEFRSAVLEVSFFMHQNVTLPVYDAIFQYNKEVYSIV